MPDPTPDALVDAVKLARTGMCPGWCPDTRSGVHAHDVLAAVPDGWAKVDGRWTQLTKVEFGDRTGTVECWTEVPYVAPY